jgi:sporulation protein YlmC with PRC-barrel domain
MIRTFLTTTALAALLASGAIAQDAPAATETPDTEAPATDTEAPATDTEAPATDTEAPATDTEAPATDAEAPATDTEGSTETQVVEDVEVVVEGADQATPGSLAAGYTATESDNLASRIMGAPVYSSEAEDAEHIGDINDLVVNENGEVVAVVIGVGGFLGIGQKEVAVDYSQLQWVIAADNTERYVLGTTREALEAAPEFQWRDEDPMATGAETAAPGAGAVGTDPAEGTDAMAPADPNAMAPAEGTVLDRTAMQEIDPASLTADDLTGTDVYGPNDEHIGTVGDLVLGEDDTIDAVIIDFGGFLGIGVKQVAVAYENLQFLGDEAGNRILVLNMTREQMEQAPEYNPDTYAQDRDAQRVVVQ